MNTVSLQQIHYATITIQYVNPPKQGQKSASIKDIEGAYYWIKPADVKNFVPGDSYDISVITTQSNGYTNRIIKSAAPRHTELPRKPAPVSHAPQDRGEPPHGGSSAHGNGNGNGNGYYRPTHPRDARRMFVTKILGDLIATGRVRDDVDSMTRAVNDLCQVWENSEISRDEYAGETRD